MARKNSTIRYELLTTQKVRKLYLKPLIRFALVANAFAALVLLYRAYELKSDNVKLYFDEDETIEIKSRHVDKVLVVTYLRSGKVACNFL